MLVQFLSPSPSEADVLDTEDKSSGTFAVLRPKRWSSKQQSLTVAPLEVVNSSGEVLCAAVLTVNQKTGNLSLSRVNSSEVRCEADDTSRKEG